MPTFISFITLCFFACSAFIPFQDRPRTRDFGIKIGVLETGSWNAITDLEGVKVGHVTLIKEDNIRTGVTVVLPHDGNIFMEKVPAGIYVANGYGKLMGSTQVEELGTLETPIVLTNTLSVPTAADAVIDYILGLPGNENIGSVNAVIGETNDGYLNDIRGRHVKKEHVLAAIHKASSGPVPEGSLGAGTGTICFRYKGGIGTSSRKLSPSQGGYTVGALVQTNHGGILQINGIRVDDLTKTHEDQDGSCMIVIATDAPLDSRNLKRLAKRSLLGIARTGGYYSNGSGDYAIAFSTAPGLRIKHRSQETTRKVEILRNERISPLFLAAVEAVEEAILNSLFKAETMKGRDGHLIESLPLDLICNKLRKEQ